MKKIIITSIVLIILISTFTYLKINNLDNYKEPEIKKDNVNTDLLEEKESYTDNNPIKLGLYKYYGRGKNRELITEYNKSWSYHNDISSFEVFYTNESTINGKYFQDTFKEYLDKYTDIDNYKIGYIISFNTKNGEINKTILSPKDTEEFFDILEIYLYDDYHREKGVWYSHTTEDEYNEETLLTSIKLTAGKNISEITSDISLTVFTYDYDDFDDYGNYKGISKYSIIVKNSK